jgi:hypothetical protein
LTYPKIPALSKVAYRGRHVSYTPVSMKRNELFILRNVVLKGSELGQLLLPV